ncbi:MAG: 5-(carboxyamino)imidazole ribonucleotide synthase [Alphaproteobacteria bacterium]
MKTLPPGSTIGILGGGQLGRMTAVAASRLGYNCHIFCPDKNEPAVAVAHQHTIGSFTDNAALADFAAQVDVVTLEWENVPLSTLEFIASHAAVHPGVNVLRVTQDREQEKTFARNLGIGTADFAIVKSLAELEKALKDFTLPVILKSTRMGYDGKGQVKITPGMSTADAWKAMGSSVGIIEAFVDFACEISVIVACRADGAMVTYPAVENIHRNHILAETHAPAGIDPAIAQEAEHVARKLAERLNVVGLLAVEMFVLRQPNKNGQRVLMNEMAPRPHNSGHWTLDACACSQFEQLVRAVCGLPLASISPHSRAVMHNIIGDDVNHWPQLLQEQNACLHLYGKTEARPGRKMGHVTYLKGTW